MSAPTQKELKDSIFYDPLTGIFSKRFRKGIRKIGYITDKGYIKIRFNKGTYMAHRLAWVYVTGSWPIDTLDHKNGIRDDNRFANLREATLQQNKQNIRVPPRLKTRIRSSKYLGVTFDHEARRAAAPWRVRFKVNGKIKCFGRFATEIEAKDAALEARRIHLPYNTL